MSISLRLNKIFMHVLKSSVYNTNLIFYDANKTVLNTFRIYEKKIENNRC